MHVQINVIEPDYYLKRFCDAMPFWFSVNGSAAEKTYNMRAVERRSESSPVDVGDLQQLKNMTHGDG